MSLMYVGLLTDDEAHVVQLRDRAPQEIEATRLTLLWQDLEGIEDLVHACLVPLALVKVESVANV